MDAAGIEHGDERGDERREDLLSTLEVIEGQPLSERAAAYALLHDELARRLESGPRDLPA